MLYHFHRQLQMASTYRNCGTAIMVAKIGTGCMDMFHRPHPGKIIREDCLKPLDLSVTVAAKWLGVSRRLRHSPIG
jgi:hypothetical protein